MGCITFDLADRPALEADVESPEVGFDLSVSAQSVSDVSLGLSGASAGQSPVVKTVDGNGKPTAWEAAVLAKADGSNVPTSSSVKDTWRTRIAALPGVKVYGKADVNGDGEVSYLDAMTIMDRQAK